MKYNFLLILIWKKKGQVKLAQEKKERMEEIQRKDAKLRKEFLKNKTKK